MKKNLKPTVLITGSSRGIGAATAKLLCKSGFEVILHGASRSDALITLSEKLNAKFLCFDVTKEEEIKKSLEGLEKLNILINSAGINISKPFLDLAPNDWQSIYDVNVFGLVNVIKYAYPLLKKNELSKIINIGSIKGTYSAVGRTAYASSKAALINITNSLAKEFAPNIIVNCVSPGFTSTKMTQDTWSNRIRDQVNSILLKRMAEPEEIAEVILFLSSNKCKYITGQNINVDGGFSIKNV
tara:strand:- start:52 stop:777 length:726 start_codon:yes stop_codon:yes gene_type:complete